MTALDSTSLPLDNWRCIRVAGSDRIDFLQGQLTQDIDSVLPAQPRFAGWANAKGRLLCTAWVCNWQDSLYLVLPAERAALVCARLRMFVLRADVTVEEAPLPVWLTVTKKPEDVPAGDCFYDESSFHFAPAPGWLVSLGAPAGKPADNDSDTDSELQLRRLCIAAGVPVISAATSEAFVPQMVNLDLLDGISFTKGCYVGQEIVARTQNLGRIKRRMFRLRTDGTVEAGMQVLGGEDNAGTIVDACPDEAGTDLLAVLRLEKTSDTLTADGAVLTFAELPYAVPEAPGTAD